MTDWSPHPALRGLADRGSGNRGRALVDPRAHPRTAEVAPRLLINSPVPECGKTVLLGVVGRVVPRPEISSNISPAALFRTIEQIHPTVLVDEADTFVVENDELRGLLNSGHTSDLRLHAPDRESRRGLTVSTKFSTWAAICIAGSASCTTRSPAGRSW